MAENLRWKLAEEPTAQTTLLAPTVRVVGRGEYRGLEFLEVDAKTIINKVPGGPRFGFEYTINAYRGCSHACAYCFARPTHEYLGLGIGADFDRKIVVKRNAVELVHAETSPSRWGGSLIAMGTNTDPYQPAEGKYRLTRGILEVLSQRHNPLSILTKSPLVLRDTDVLVEAAGRAKLRIDFSIGTLDEDVWKLTEPNTPHPQRRIEAVARLNGDGVPAGVLMGPVIPGLSDGEDQLRTVVAAAVAAGAVGVGHVVLHLGAGLRGHYLTWLADHRPDLLRRYESWYTRKQAIPEVRRRVGRIVSQALTDLGAAPHRTTSTTPASSVDEPVAASIAQLRLGLR